AEGRPGQRRFRRVRERGARLRPRRRRLPHLPGRHGATALAGAGGRPGIRHGACAQGLPAHGAVRRRLRASRAGRARRGPAPPFARRHGAGAGPRRGAVLLGRGRDRPGLGHLGRDPGGPPARRAGLPPAPLQRLLVRQARADAGRGGARAAALAGRVAGLGRRARLPRLRQRGVRLLRRGRGFGPGGAGARPRQPLGGPRGGARHGDAGPARRGHRVPRRAGAALGGRQQPCAPPLVAPGDVPPGAAGVRHRARPLRPPLPRSRLAAGGGDAGLHHGRAERRLHAVPLGAARRGGGGPLGRAGRQGGGADRRLALALHLAAPDDGAGRRRTLGGGGAHVGGVARGRAAVVQLRRHGGAGAARRGAAGVRGRAGASARRLRGRGGGDAAGARRDAPPRRQPRAAGRAGAAFPRRGDAGRLRRRRADAAGAGGGPASRAAFAADRLRGRGAVGGAL
ncbi:MAG: hypothetical protein AVDCRST_MAG04-343, partial [uncultured Acetobacteraceae bacterium]